MIAAWKKVATIGCFLMVLSGFVRYPTIEEAGSLFTCGNPARADPNLSNRTEYEGFLSALRTNRCEATLPQQLQMKDFLLTALTSIVMRVSTNAVDDGMATLAQGRNRGDFLLQALQPFGLDFTTNATDCLAVAEYIGRVRTEETPGSLHNRMMSVLYVTKDPQKREEWCRKSRELRETRTKTSPPTPRGGISTSRFGRGRTRAAP